MVKRILLLVITAFAGYTLAAQSPAAFQYQAVVRNSAGEVLPEQSVAFRLSILQGEIEGESVYTETHDEGVTTNQFGVISLEIGKGQSSESFSDINWSEGPYFLKIELDIEGGTEYQHIGTNQLLSVPFSMYAEKAGSVGIVKAAEGHDSEEPVFQVQNKDGEVIFAVYESGVVINIDEDSPKGSRAGFAVGGFSSQKENEVTDFLVVERDSVMIFIEDDPAKGSRAGFAVGGFSSQKQETSREFMSLNPESFFIWLDQDVAEQKGSRGGFAVGGFTNQKQEEGTTDFLRVTADSTRLWFDDSPAKGSRAGFAVGGFSSQKSGDSTHYLNITPGSSNIFIDTDYTKSDPFGGFAITGFDNAGELRNLLRVTRDTTFIATTVNATKDIDVEGNINLGGTVEELTFIDERNGRKYRWIQIGNQIWMADNLRYGEAGVKVYNDDTALGDVYGFLYPWEVASGGTASDAEPSGVKGICPAGWHLPSEAEWTEMIDYLGDQVAGTKMKSREIWDGTNESRFDARPGGYGSYDEYDDMYYYNDLGNSTGFWTSTQSEPEGIVNHYVLLQTVNDGVNIEYAWDSPQNFELRYVRCIKD
ncbi:MAG: FISUMP domain-containing protein [Bacteroidales bacterium]